MANKVVDKKFLERFAWEYKTGKYTGRSKADVTVRIADVKQKLLVITFRNKTADLISGEYIVWCIYKNRIMFTDAEDKNGFKLSASKSPHIKHVAMTIDDKKEKEYEKFVGDYNLKVDDFYGLYYIELKGGVENE